MLKDVDLIVQAERELLLKEVDNVKAEIFEKIQSNSDQGISLRGQM